MSANQTVAIDFSSQKPWTWDDYLKYKRECFWEDLFTQLSWTGTVEKMPSPSKQMVVFKWKRKPRKDGSQLPVLYFKIKKDKSGSPVSMVISDGGSSLRPFLEEYREQIMKFVNTGVKTEDMDRAPILTIYTTVRSLHEEFPSGPPISVKKVKKADGTDDYVIECRLDCSGDRFTADVVRNWLGEMERLEEELRRGMDIVNCVLKHQH